MIGTSNMDTPLSIPPQVTQILSWMLWLLAIANDTILPFNGWILSPSSLPPSLGWCHTHPAFTTVVYALSEPVYTWLLMQYGSSPEILLLCVPPALLGVTMVCTTGYKVLTNELPHHATRDPEPLFSNDKQAENADLPPPRWKPALALALLLLPVHTSAFTNSLLLLTTAIFTSSQTSTPEPVTTLLTITALCIYLSNHFSDYLTSTHLQRPLYLHLRRIPIQLQSLLILLFLRTLTRLLLGLPISLVFGTLSADSIARMLESTAPREASPPSVVMAWYYALPWWVRGLGVPVTVGVAWQVLAGALERVGLVEGEGRGGETS